MAQRKVVIASVDRDRNSVSYGGDWVGVSISLEVFERLAGSTPSVGSSWLVSTSGPSFLGFPVMAIAPTK